MKKLVCTFCGLVALLNMSQLAYATLFFSDHFNYPDGELTVYNGTGANVSGGLWVPHSGFNFPTSIDVISGRAVLKQGNPASEDAHRLAGTTMAPGDTWYYAALVTVNDERPDPSSESLLNAYFMHFRDFEFGFTGRVYVDNPAGGGDFRFGLSASSGGQTVAWPNDSSFGTENLLVVSYDFDSGTTQLWVNPTDITSPFIIDSNPAAQGTTIESLALRQEFNPNFNTNSEQLIHAVALGSSFEAVVAAVIPEPTGLVLILLGLAGLAIHRPSCS